MRDGKAEWICPHSENPPDQRPLRALGQGALGEGEIGRGDRRKGEKKEGRMKRGGEEVGMQVE